MDQDLMERIRESAYHIWAANGGDAEQNWLQAEAEILNNAAKGAAPKKAARRFQAEGEENGFPVARPPSAKSPGIRPVSSY
jgi:Protein of unknown function (DUF2934)